MNVEIRSYGDADNRPEWDYTDGDRVEILTSLTERLGTVEGNSPGRKWVRVRVDGGEVESFYPGEIRRI